MWWQWWGFRFNLKIEISQFKSLPWHQSEIYLKKSGMYLIFHLFKVLGYNSSIYLITPPPLSHWLNHCFLYSSHTAWYGSKSCVTRPCLPEAEWRLEIGKLIYGARRKELYISLELFRATYWSTSKNLEKWMMIAWTQFKMVSIEVHSWIARDKRSRKLLGSFSPGS